MKQRQIAEVEKLLRTVYRKLRQEIHLIIGSEVSLNEFMVLKYLFLTGRAKASDLSKELKVSASHITSVTDSLVKKGLIMRQRSDQDRRIVEMVLTDSGRLLVQNLEEKKSAYFQSKFSHFSEQELSDFIRLFQKLNE
ncbi:MarR family winged helix-turn-helix transcriptional regulator [Bacillus methanolicus]|uniref:YpoP n=1 Tax=Bacillus methanolicus (strain MGA3 / ATCC 53907) TaxID=796606 RepID=A0A068LY16_BACMM|nr:MarR family transcriptional regulator [Bacillus methanolicus]AIE60407.1 YpoP [Bacillus methanolicus MGA3]